MRERNMASTMSHNTHSQLSAHEKRTVAVAALVDPRTLQRALRGQRVQPMALVRIRAALAAHGFAHLLSVVGAEKKTR